MGPLEKGEVLIPTGTGFFSVNPVFRLAFVTWSLVPAMIRRARCRSFKGPGMVEILINGVIEGTHRNYYV